MRFLDILKSKTTSSQTKSKYEHLPLVNPAEDKKTPKGYVERKFITEEKIYQSCTNIFYDSNIPIVNACESATKYIGTMVLQNPNGQKVRSVTEIIYYSVPETLQADYIHLISNLNNLIIKYRLPSKYTITLEQIVFTLSPNGYTQIPTSHIQYEQEKNEFHFIFSNLIKKNGPYKYSTPVYESTESGNIIFTDEGRMKKAQFKITLKGHVVKIRFKDYKSGFDLWDINYNGETIYKKDSK